MSPIPIFVLVLTVAAAACTPSADTFSPAGEWVLEASTLDGFTRSCAPLDFGAGAPTFTVEARGDRLRLAFDDLHGTAMAAEAGGDGLVARHLMPTSSIGRPCGRTLEVEVRLRRADREGAERLKGRWQPQGCDVCPGVELAATRVP